MQMVAPVGDCGLFKIAVEYIPLSDHGRVVLPIDVEKRRDVSERLVWPFLEATTLALNVIGRYRLGRPTLLRSEGAIEWV